MKLKGSQIIVKCIEEQGVDTVFGYPGGSILDVFDALECIVVGVSLRVDGRRREIV